MAHVLRAICVLVEMNAESHWKCAIAYEEMDQQALSLAHSSCHSLQCCQMSKGELQFHYPFIDLLNNINERCRYHGEYVFNKRRALNIKTVHLCSCSIRIHEPKRDP